MYGRKDGQQRKLNPLPYPSLADAWPLIRSIIRRRLRHGYQIKEPEEIGRFIARLQGARAGVKLTTLTEQASLEQLAFENS
jgi:hypothetical protein